MGPDDTLHLLLPILERRVQALNRSRPTTSTGSRACDRCDQQHGQDGERDEEGQIVVHAASVNSAGPP